MRIDVTELKPFRRDVFAPEPQFCSINAPFEAHAHFRFGDLAVLTLMNLATYAWGGVGMPNLKPPITDKDRLYKYTEFIWQVVDNWGINFHPFYLLGLHDGTTCKDVQFAESLYSVLGFKMYLQGTTTNSDGGVSDMFSSLDVYRLMSDYKLVHSGHYEEPKPPGYPIEEEYKLEKEAIWRVQKLHEMFPDLKIVVEHVSTQKMIEAINEMPANVTGTLAIQHAVLTTPDALANVNKRCKPIAKSAEDREAVIREATRKDSKFFMGNDLAAHAAPKTLPGVWPICPVAWWASIFEQRGTMDRLNGFTSIRGPEFYGLKPSPNTLTLVKKLWTIPEAVTYNSTTVIPLCAGEMRSDWEVVT